MFPRRSRTGLTAILSKHSVVLPDRVGVLVGSEYAWERRTSATSSGRSTWISPTRISTAGAATAPARLRRPLGRVLKTWSATRSGALSSRGPNPVEQRRLRQQMVDMEARLEFH